jgi:shikimate dehydrogenase
MEYEKMKEALYDSEILINTTTVGMYPHIDDSPVDKSLLRENLIVCDIVYNPKRTKLLKDAEALGCKVVFGLPMLVYQGAEAFKLWTGMEAPVDVMFKAVESNS